MAPLFAEFAEKNKNAVFVKVDVDKNQDIAAEAGVSMLPTFQLYKSGIKADSFSGGHPDKLTSLVTKNL